MAYRQKSMRLAELCKIQTGYTARTALKPTEAGGVPAIQLRDLRGEDEFDPSRLPLYALGGGFDRYWAGPGDVLFRSRGDQNTAVTITPDTSAAIAVLPLLVLRPKRDVIDPHYLAWFINQPMAQRYFDRSARGTRMRMIPRPCLEELEIALPDLVTQRIVVEIDRLARRESELLGLLAEKKKAFTSFALLAKVRKAQPHCNGAGRSVARRNRNPVGKSERTNT